MTRWSTWSREVMESGKDPNFYLIFVCRDPDDDRQWIEKIPVEAGKDLEALINICTDFMWEAAKTGFIIGFRNRDDCNLYSRYKLDKIEVWYQTKRIGTIDRP